MKVVVWGKGVRGMQVLNSWLHRDIVAIVEQDKSLHGTVYEGVDIISPEKYFKDYSNFPVLVTPKDTESQIIQQLSEVGIHWTFSFTNEWGSMLSLFQQLPIRDMISCYDKGETLGIWGYNMLSLLLYDFLCNEGYCCVMILKDSINEYVIKYLKNILGIKVEISKTHNSNIKRILLTEDMNEDEKVFFKENRFERYYGLGWDKERFFNPLLEKYKGIHQGERVFIVATGPSLVIKDLEKLHQNNELCISLNGIFAAFENTDWRPDYYIIADPTVMKTWKDEIISLNAKEKFIADTATIHPEEVGVKWHCVGLWGDKEIMIFSDDFACNAYVYSTIAHAALQLAVYMGFKEIYLLGVDCTYKKDSTDNHFYQPQNQDDKARFNLDGMRKGYLSARVYADKHDIKIYNATRGGELEIFERVDFDSLF